MYAGRHEPSVYMFFIKCMVPFYDVGARTWPSGGVRWSGQHGQDRDCQGEHVYCIPIASLYMLYTKHTCILFDAGTQAWPSGGVCRAGHHGQDRDSQGEQICCIPNTHMFPRTHSHNQASVYIFFIKCMVPVYDAGAQTGPGGGVRWSGQHGQDRDSQGAYMVYTKRICILSNALAQSAVRITQ